MSLQAGKLNRRVTVMRPVETRGAAYGDRQVEWEPVYSPWAALEPLSGDQLVRMKQEGSTTNWRVRIRYRAGITTKMRVVHGDHVLAIDAVVHLRDAREEIHLMCTEQNDG